MLSARLGSLRAYETETSAARVRLSSNELPYDLPRELKRRIGEEVKRIPLHRYPDPGCRELKVVLADFFGVGEENLLLGNGSDELVYYLSVAVGELDQGVYIPVPTFPMYEISADVFGRPKVAVPLGEDFDIDLQESLKRLREEGAVLAYFSYPNNPTGNLFSEEKIRAIRGRCLLAAVDEAYYHYSRRSFLEEALRREDTVVLRTLSKIGLAGLRVGVLIAREELIRELEKIRLPFNVSYPSQVIARLVLTEGRDFIEWAVEKVVSERERLRRELSAIEGVEVFPSSANFLLFRTPFPAGELHAALLRRGVLVRNVSHLPRLERCLRVSVGREEENDLFLEALNSAVRELGG